MSRNDPTQVLVAVHFDNPERHAVLVSVNGDNVIMEAASSHIRRSVPSRLSHETLPHRFDQMGDGEALLTSGGAERRRARPSSSNPYQRAR